MSLVKRDLETAIADVCKDLFDATIDVALSRPDEQFGDFATNAALQLAGQLGQKPREIAERLAEKLRLVLTGSVSEIAVAGPGFLNLTLHDRSLITSLDAQTQKNLASKTIVVEYSDPNPFKPLHAGHLYTTLVGDTIARLIEHAGAKTIRVNYGGDVGLHVAKSMWAISKQLGGELPEKLVGIAEAERPQWLGARYVEGNNAYEDNETAKAEIVAINKRVYQLHANRDQASPFAQIYWTCRQWSYDYFAELYKQLHVKPFDRYIPESEVTALGLEAVEAQLARGVFERSDGAVIFDGGQAALHTRVFINSQGLPTYEAKDVGLSLTKWQDYHFDESIIITANEQAQYMQVVLAAIGQFAPEPAERTRHLTHGVVKLQGGVKMSSRKGNVVTALEILDAARTAGAASDTNPSEDTILAAVKYALVKNRVGGDVVYVPKESIALEGNSGPYLQYAHARAKSILQKTEHKNSPLIDLEPAERSLVHKISEYPEVVDKATAELMPHLICTYLYELAQSFNQFYEKNRVIGDAREAVRLQLVMHYSDTLKNGLNLLGITAPDHM